MGDSLNDLSILKICDFPLLYRPVEALRSQFPGAAVAHNLDEALKLLQGAAKKYDSNDGGG